MSPQPSQPPKGGASFKRRIVAPVPTLDSRFRAILRSPETRKYVESIAITGLAPVIGWLVQPTDPLFLHNRFPWLIVPPVLIALRHGFGPGTTSALLLVGGVLARNQARGDGSGVPSELLFGMVLLAMLVGEIAASMTRRMTAVEADNDHVRTQFEGFSRSYALLELSHERLEQRSEPGITPLRAALTSLALTTKETGDAPSLAAMAQNMLLIMGAYGHVQSACVYAVGASGKIEGEPLAKIGRPSAVSATDPLVVGALSKGQVAHVGSGVDADRTSLLIAVPVIDADDKRIGLVAIEAIPLFAIETLNLRLLHVVAGHVADAVSPSRWEEAAASDEWSRLRKHLDRACVEAAAGRLPGVAMAFWCKKGDRGTAALEGLLGRDLRVTDHASLQRDANGNPVLFAVMPLTDGQGAKAFLARLDGLCRQRLGADLSNSGLQSRTWLLAKDSSAKAILGEFATVMKAGEGAEHASPRVVGSTDGREPRHEVS